MTYDTPHTNFGTRLRELRRSKGWTLDELARRSGSSKGYIWELENRDRRKPSAKKLQDIAKALSVTVEFLLGGGEGEKDTRTMVMLEMFKSLSTEDQSRIMQIMDLWRIYDYE